jgi:hypothetical protein
MESAMRMHDDRSEAKEMNIINHGRELAIKMRMLSYYNESSRL